MKRLLILSLLIESLACRASSRVAAAQDSAIVAAVKFARGLQQTYWDSLYIPQKRLPARAVILAHFGRGYGDSLAAVYTEYAVSHAPEPVMVAPDNVTVLHSTVADGYAAYATPETLREIWGDSAYTTDYLQNVGGHWKVVRSAQTSSKPVGK